MAESNIVPHPLEELQRNDSNQVSETTDQETTVARIPERFVSIIRDKTERTARATNPQWNKIDQDAEQKSDEFLALMEKLLLRERKDPSNGRVVSMLESATRFFPLFDQRDESSEILYNAHAQQC